MPETAPTTAVARRHRSRPAISDRERLLEADEIIEFARRYDPEPFHLSEEGAVDTLFGTLAASGWHTAAITMRLVVTSAIRSPPASSAPASSSPGRHRPPGDVLHVDLAVDSVTPSRSKPDRGFVGVTYDTVNQHDAVRQHTVANLLAFRRPGASSRRPSAERHVAGSRTSSRTSRA